MIDDLSPIYISYKDNEIKPWYDWGYERFNDNSLLNYFYTQFLDKFPETQGTIFMPLKSEDGISKTKNSGMNIKSNSFSILDKTFFKKLSIYFDFAFHGLEHASYKNNDVTKEYLYETDFLKNNDLQRIEKELKIFSSYSGNKMSGGKFTGYDHYNPESFKLIKNLGFKWWALSLSNNKKNNNSHKYIKVGKTKILDLPTNLTGNAFKKYLEKSNLIKSYYYSLKKLYKIFQLENYIDFLYSNQYVITIQEHFQNQAFNGKIQTPNVFDDIISLENIYSILRGSDVWHCNNSKLSQYLESYDNTEVKIENDKINIKYNGHWDKMFLSFISSNSSIKNADTGMIVKGIYKNNLWIFNDLAQGEYLFKK